MTDGNYRAVAQLVEWSIPAPEVHSSNPVIGKLLYRTFVYGQLFWKDENKEKNREWLIYLNKN